MDSFSVEQCKVAEQQTEFFIHLILQIFYAIPIGRRIEKIKRGGKKGDIREGRKQRRI